jgi:PDZ domain-containing protein
VEPRHPRPSRKVVTSGRLIALGLIVLVGASALWVYPSNEYIFLPDPAHPVAPLVSVAGSKAGGDPGSIYYVDVIVRKATLLEKLFGGLHDGADLQNPSSVVAPGVSDAQRRQVDLREMKQSQQVAASVALRAAGMKVTTVNAGALITDIIPGFPAVGRLEPTDVIVAIDGKPVRTPDDIKAAMHAKHVGDAISFTVQRGATKRVVQLTTAPAGPGSQRAVVGIVLDQAERFHLPIRVTIDSGQVGGPSAGLAFALEVLKKLGRNVDGGHKIAATGEIFLNGDIGPIGGIKQKTIGAREAGVDAFLVPAGENFRDARKYAHGLRIIPVKSFQQALHALATLPANS